MHYFFSSQKCKKDIENSKFLTIKLQTRSSIPDADFCSGVVISILETTTFFSSSPSSKRSSRPRNWLTPSAKESRPQRSYMSECRTLACSFLTFAADYNSKAGSGRRRWASISCADDSPLGLSSGRAILDALRADLLNDNLSEERSRAEPGGLC